MSNQKITDLLKTIEESLTEIKSILNTSDVISRPPLNGSCAVEKFEQGKWYSRKGDNTHLCFNGVYDMGLPCGYGFVDGEWENEDGYGWSIMTEKADVKVIENLLIQEAKNRGFKEGVIVSWNQGKNILSENGGFFYDAKDDLLLWSFNKEKNVESGFIIYEQGEWAEIIEETIDWSVPMKVISTCGDNVIVQTTGKHGHQVFEGVVIDGGRSETEGTYSDDWDKMEFEPLKKEV